MLLFNDSLFHSIDTLLLGYVKARGSSVLLSSLEYVVRGVYTLLPMLDPFNDKTADLETSMRVTAGDWQYLGLTLAYATLVFAVCFVFADYRLRRKALI